MVFIKWLSIIVFSTFLCWLIPLLFWDFSIGAFNSSPEDEKDMMIKEIAHDFSNTIQPIIKDIKARVGIKVQGQQGDAKVSMIKFTGPKPLMSQADKQCNTAIFNAMNNKSKSAQQAKRQACAHNSNSF